MNKKFLHINILLFGLFYFNNSYASELCINKYGNYLNIKTQYDEITYKINNLYNEITERFKGTGGTTRDVYNTYISEKNELLTKGVSIENCLNEVTSQLSSLFDNGYNAYNKGNYEDAIIYYKQYLEINGDTSSSNYNSAKNNLILSYKAFAAVYFAKKDFNNALINYKMALDIDKNDSNILTNIGACYNNLGDYDNSLNYYQEAYKNASDKSTIDDIQKRIELTKEQKNNQELLKNAPTNDQLSGYQYYLKQLNIIDAWSKIKNNNQVIVAVIDDGISINHPDLTSNIWIDKNAKYGDNKVIDFVGDGLLDNATSGEHGTMVAGIIGATKNNNEGIAGIANNVKLMPLRVFDTKGGATEEYIINAMNYAIDNGANIINLSLGQTQFKYSDKFDTVIKRAFDSGVIVVIAAGNGDIMSNQQNGVNLDINPISPVCNNEAKYKYSIGVYATDENGYRTSWTNYGQCAKFSSPGVGIVSTSVPLYNSNYGTNYNSLDGTSFSAPIISGIIALGYNQYGYVNPVDVYDALEESKVNFTLPDGQIGYKIDASKYIDVLGMKLQNSINEKTKIENENKLKQQQANYESILNQKAEKVFNQLKSKFTKYSNVNKKNKYNSILNQLNGLNGKLQGDNVIILNHLIYLIKQELNDIQ